MLFQVVGRLKPGVTPERAEVELDSVARQIERAFNDPDRDRQGRRVTLIPGGKLLPLRKQDLKLMTVFPLALVGLVLLIACSNVGNMQVARAASRRREMASYLCAPSTSAHPARRAQRRTAQTARLSWSSFAKSRRRRNSPM
jgi:hypothetical protein